MRGLDSILISGTTDSIDFEKPEVLRRFFQCYDKDDIETLDDAKLYIALLSRFRAHIETYTSLNGKNFLHTMRSIFAVGPAGLYTNRLRFLFELIQNVDDCDYEEGSDPQLVICFDTANKRLLFRYNELGFTPGNVFAITGIAEEAKNTEEKKIQIGEKGIGFKSVFGVAKSVLIRSGKFSFRLNRDHFTIPIPEYEDGFSEINGTELTIEFDSAETFDNVVNLVKSCYQSEEALFLQNPIVFLNKLSHLEFVSDGEEFLSFHVTRPPVTMVDEVNRLSVGHGMTLSVGGKGNPICGTYYSKTIRYTIQDCKSRYGENTQFNGREMEVKAFFPEVAYVVKGGGSGTLRRGLMYSYLPTRVELEVPIICHAPFKLDASREYVDSQNRNDWFLRTLSTFRAFLNSCYRLQAAEVHENVVAYLPKVSRSIFTSNDNVKMDDLLRDQDLRGEAIVKNKFFYCSDGHYYSASDIVSMNNCVDIDRPTEILRLCGEHRPFFCSPDGFNPRWYNIDCIDAPYDKMFAVVFNNYSATPDDIRKAVEIARRGKPELIRDFCRDARFKSLSDHHLKVLAEGTELRLFTDALAQKIRRGEASDFSFRATSPAVRRVSVFDLINEDVQYEDMGRYAAKYFRSIDGRCIVLEGIPGRGFCIPASNMCVVAGDKPASGIVELCRKLDPSNLFSVRLVLKAASASLDAAMDTDNPREFLELLRNVRKTSKDAMGDRAYKSFLDLIQKAGTSSDRCINELLQNADDCEYSQDVEPSLEIAADDSRIVVKTNEKGFKANNVRAITAIGESTKELLLGEHVSGETIGYKGVGFKSVFAIADSVEIHSGGFDFIINATEPTIPRPAECVELQSGTTMTLKLKKNFQFRPLREEEVLRRCICLRRLKHIKIFDCEVLISDEENSFRSVVVNGSEHGFYMCEHEFYIHDVPVVQSRKTAGNIRVTRCQKVRCYVPTKINAKAYKLYCGLPTEVIACASLIIDAPFELTTSRQEVLEDSGWNKCVLENVYAAVLKTAEMVKGHLRINVLHLLGSYSSVKTNGVISCRSCFFKGVGEGFLNKVNAFIDRVRRACIIPVLGGKDAFLRPDDDCLRIFPDFLSKIYESEHVANPMFKVVDLSNGQRLDDLKGALKALNVRELNEGEFWTIIEGLGQLSRRMGDEEFRTGVYKYLCKLRQSDRWTDLPNVSNKSSEHPIVPVITESGTCYVCARGARQLFYSYEQRKSTDSYYIVDTKIMGRRLYEDIFCDELREMNDAMERELYCNYVCRILLQPVKSKEEKYEFLQKELDGPNSVNLQRCMATISSLCREQIPLKNLKGELTLRKLFVVNEQDKSRLRGQLLKAVIVDKECSFLANLLKCPRLSEIVYRDLPETPWVLTREDAYDIYDGNIADNVRILTLAFTDGRISEELAQELGIIPPPPNPDVYPFPEEPIRSIQQLKAHIRDALENPIRIESKKVERYVDFCVPNNGNEFELSSTAARAAALHRYSPQGNAKDSTKRNTNFCFCQMCGALKQWSYMEVNCIEKSPEFYFPELRLALCLECSKRFEMLRNNKEFYEVFIKRLSAHCPQNNEDNVCIEVPLSDVKHLFRFTRTHFAEIQEILNGRRTIVPKTLTVEELESRQKKLLQKRQQGYLSLESYLKQWQELEERIKQIRQ